MSSTKYPPTELVAEVFHQLGYRYGDEKLEKLNLICLKLDGRTFEEKPDEMSRQFMDQAGVIGGPGDLITLELSFVNTTTHKTVAFLKGFIEGLFTNKRKDFILSFVSLRLNHCMLYTWDVVNLLNRVGRIKFLDIESSKFDGHAYPPLFRPLRRVTLRAGYPRFNKEALRQVRDYFPTNELVLLGRVDWKEDHAAGRQLVSPSKSADRFVSPALVDLMFRDENRTQQKPICEKFACHPLDLDRMSNFLAKKGHKIKVMSACHTQRSGY